MKIRIRPKEGLKVPYPMSKRFLNPEGEEVERSSYWIRRLRDKDVEEVQVEKPKPAPKKNKSTKKMEVES